MKRFSIFAAAAAALMLASCAESGINETTTEAIASQNSASKTPVAFSSYMPGTTRAGAVATMDDDKLKETGFGVFAYYTESAKYGDQGVDSVPNFMYNQEVTYSNGWTYSPLKYWPNESAQATDVDQQTDPAETPSGADYLSFFAYAPYVDFDVDGENYKNLEDVDNSDVTKSDTVGIVGATNNATTGDPIIKYITAEKAKNCVDLLWGVIPDDSCAKSGEDIWKISSSASTEGQSFDMGYAWKNVVKPNTTDVIKFYFRHALSKLHLTVQAAFDEVEPGENDINDGTLDGTVITVDSVSITNFGLAKEGYLNLNNTTSVTPLWQDANGNALAFKSNTITAGIANDEISDSIADNGKWALQTPTEGVDGKYGVTLTKKYLLQSDDEEEYDWMFIPGTPTENIKIYISYWVTTKDENLKNGFSRIHNVITKDISPFALYAGKIYTINCILGMTSVKFDAYVEDWDSDTTEQPVYLPMNVEGE